VAINILLQNANSPTDSKPIYKDREGYTFPRLSSCTLFSKFMDVFSA